MKRFFQMLMVATVATTGTTYAQYAGDAVRFSQGNYGSSARLKGMGNAQVSVGGDVSSLGGNPAGLGFFTRSEFSFTPEFNNFGSKSTYLNNRLSADDSKMNLNHIGAVWYNPTYVPAGQNTGKGVLSTVFGIGYNRNNDYSQAISYGGTNTANSFRSYLGELANGSKDVNDNLKDRTLEMDAYNGFLINLYENGVYDGNPVSSNNQLRNETRAGGTSELNFSGAINISNEVYIGLSVGIVNLRYTTNAVYTESGNLNPYNTSTGSLGGLEPYTLNYKQSQETTGSGFNGRLGVIVRPVSNFRIGAILQTPTWMSIDDSFSESLNNTLSQDKFTGGSYTYPYVYNLRTPLKGSLGASYVIGTNAILSADVDYIDYSSIRFSDAGNNYDPDIINKNNTNIRENYKQAVNFRLGGEYRLNNVNLRAGYGMNGSPMKDDNSADFNTKYYSAGIGYRVAAYSLDLAYQRVQSMNQYTTYGLADGSEPVASVDNNMNNVFLTLGLRF
jgi:hypothetical protein